MDSNSEKEYLAFFYLIDNYSDAQLYEPRMFRIPFLQKLFVIVKPFLVTYNVSPTVEQVLQLINSKGYSDNEFNAETIRGFWAQWQQEYSRTDKKYLRDVCQKLASYNYLISSLEVVATQLTEGAINMNNIDVKLPVIMNKFTVEGVFTGDVEPGHDFADPEAHKQLKIETVTTGYPFMDVCLGGGWATKTLNIIAGQPKIGKSQWLCNIAANSINAGYNTAYITLELDESLVMKRIGSNVFNIPYEQYDSYAEDANLMTEKIREWNNSGFGMSGRGKLIVKSFPTSSASAHDIEKFLVSEEKRLSVETNTEFKFRHVCIDYINIMADGRYGNNTTETYMKIKGICEDVRAAMQRNDWCGISLTQINRDGTDSSDITMNNVAESSGTPATVDSLFAIVADVAMRSRGQYKLKALALRNSNHMDDAKEYDFDHEYLRIIENSNDIIQAGTVLANKKQSGMHRLQQTSPEPVVPQSVDTKNIHLGDIENERMMNVFDF